MNTPTNSVPEWEEIVRKQVKSMRFGLVQLVIHDGRVVQIERTEKLRLDKAESREEQS